MSLIYMSPAVTSWHIILRCLWEFGQAAGIEIHIMQPHLLFSVWSAPNKVGQSLLVPT